MSAKEGQSHVMAYSQTIAEAGETVFADCIFAKTAF